LVLGYACIVNTLSTVDYEVETSSSDDEDEATSAPEIPLKKYIDTSTRHLKPEVPKNAVITRKFYHKNSNKPREGFGTQEQPQLSFCRPITRLTGAWEDTGKLYDTFASI